MPITRNGYNGYAPGTLTSLEQERLLEIRQLLAQRPRIGNEADTIGACLASVVAQRAVADLQIIVLDDRSSDDTAAIVQGVASDDQRVRLITGTEPAAGWLGKPNACQVLADHAQGDILIFIDSDVCLSEHAVAATVAALAPKVFMWAVIASSNLANAVSAPLPSGDCAGGDTNSNSSKALMRFPLS